MSGKWYQYNIIFVMMFLFLNAGYFLHISDTNAAKNKIFVCYCGKWCECHFEADKFGKCVCGDNLFPSDRRPAETSEYVCGCENECECGSKSDKEGNCVCGKPMKKA